PTILETFNPAKNHVYHRYYKPYKEGKLPVYRLFITALATDNTYLDPSYIEQLKNADKITKERLLYGNFEYDDDPSKIFEYDKILDMFSEGHVIETGAKRYISCDVARFGEDKTVIIVWLGHYIEKIYHYPRTSMREVRDELIRLSSLHGVYPNNIIVDEDGVGGGVVDFMKGIRGFVNNSSPKETKSSKKFHNYANLKTQCYFKLAEKVNAGEIKIYEDCPLEVKELIIEDLEQVAQKDIDKEQPIRLVPKEEVKERIGRSPDFSDAIMMRMYFDIIGGYRPYIA
ncbi:hypothetical protein LCGC14_2649800, partial [marine sediment metagenome]